MGLAGRKQKRRIPADPRNLGWAGDASRFGLSYLSKFGWDASQGLGTSGDGVKTHLKVQQKLDMMGIGAQHLRDQDGIAWKQNKEFEALLTRLNANAEQERQSDSEETKTVHGREREVKLGDKAFVHAAAEVTAEEGLGDVPLPTTIKKNRKRKDPDDPDVSEKAKKKLKARHQESSQDTSSVAVISPKPDLPSISPPPVPYPEPTAKPRPIAHRARIRAAKRIVGKPASAISEILGIAPSSSASTSTSTPALTPLSSSTPVPQPISLNNLTTSTKSVADYFREKLLARSAAPASSSSSDSTTPGLGATRLGTNLPCISPPDGESGLRRMRIGLQAPMIAEVCEPVSVFAPADDSGNADALTEKVRRKAERKAEKRNQMGEQETEGKRTSGRRKKRGEK